MMALSLCAEARGLFLQVCRDPTTQTRIHGPSKHDKSPCSNGEKAPRGVNPLLQGLGGYTRRVRSRAPTGTTKYKTRSRQELLRTKSRQNLGRVPALLPRLGGYCRIPQVP